MRRVRVKSSFLIESLLQWKPNSYFVKFLINSEWINDLRGCWKHGKTKKVTRNEDSQKPVNKVRSVGMSLVWPLPKLTKILSIWTVVERNTDGVRHERKMGTCRNNYHSFLCDTLDKLRVYTRWIFTPPRSWENPLRNWSPSTFSHFFYKLRRVGFSDRNDRTQC